MEIYPKLIYKTVNREGIEVIKKTRIYFFLIFKWIYYKNDPIKFR